VTGRGRLALALLTALLLQGCPRATSSSGPVPLAVVPSQGTGLAPLAVAIAGAHFDASTTTDFANRSGTLDAAFQARLVPDAGGAAVALDSVRLTADRRLLANVPAGIGRGAYSLEVTDPAGRVGVLAQAFRVVSPPESVAAFRVARVEAAYAAVPFLVALTAVDGAGAVVDGFTGTVQLTDLTGRLTPASAGPFAFGAIQLQVTVPQLAAGDRITASDGLGHSGTSTAFDVIAGPPATVAFTSLPATVAAGACVTATFELRDAHGFPTSAPSALPVLLQSAPPGALAFHGGGGACSSPIISVTLSTGASSASFRFVASAAGSASLRLAPSGLPSATQDLTITP
jgi:hypothetical protein